MCRAVLHLCNFKEAAWHSRIAMKESIELFSGMEQPGNLGHIMELVDGVVIGSLPSMDEIEDICSKG